MKTFITIAFALLSFVEINAQVAKTIVVEHFTNSRCGICANRNPGFYNNLSNQEGVLHLSIHPSAPYSTCEIHQHNTQENDDRTNYYGVYGGTPRLVIQGTALSAGADYSSATIFDAYEDKISDFSVRIEQRKTEDMFFADVIIKAEADNSVETLQLFTAAVEDTLFYQGTNGEDEHYDVFRAAFDGAATGTMITVPAVIGDSLIVSYAIAPHADWDYDRMYAMAILQYIDSKTVVQVGVSQPSDDFTVGIKEVNELEALVFPNPTKDQLTVNLQSDESTVAKLYDNTGKLLQERTFSRTVNLHLNTLPAGLYLLQLENKEGQSWLKVVRG